MIVSSFATFRNPDGMKVLTTAATNDQTSEIHIYPDLSLTSSVTYMHCVNNIFKKSKDKPEKHNSYISIILIKSKNPPIFFLKALQIKIKKSCSERELKPWFPNSYPLIAEMQQFIHPQSRTKHESWMAQAITVRVYLSRSMAALIMRAVWPHARGPAGCHGNAQSFWSYACVSLAIIMYH